MKRPTNSSFLVCLKIKTLISYKSEKMFLGYCHLSIHFNEPQFDIGVIKDDKFFIKLGLPCCTCGIKKVPEWFNPILLGNGQCLCLKQFAAFPPQPLICAVCCIQCVPNMGIFKPPTAGGAPDNSTMQR